MATPREILIDAFQRASARLDESFIDNEEIRSRIEVVCRNLQNRALARLLLACSLAKIHNPAIDIRKPYTEIGDPDSFSGRYVEAYQALVLAQPDSAVSPPLKEAWLALRQAAESGGDNLRQADAR